MAAMIFHHSPAIHHSGMAIQLAEKSFQLGYQKGKRLYAAAMDRLLMKQKRKQKFGTQFYQKNSNRQWVLWPISPSTTDRQRIEYHVPSLMKINRQLVLLNKELIRSQSVRGL